MSCIDGTGKARSGPQETTKGNALPYPCPASVRALSARPVAS